MHALSPSGLSDAPLAELVTAASSEPVMDRQVETRLAQLIREGDHEALERLVRANIRIAVDEAIRNRGLGEYQARLVRAGTRALIESAATYDPVVDGPFSAYARQVVRGAIQRSLRPS